MPPRWTSSIAMCSALRRSMPGLLDHLLRRPRRAAARRSGGRACRRATPCASMPTASMTEIGPRPSVSSRTASGRSSSSLEVERLDAVRARAREPLGHEVDADHPAGAAVLRDARAHLADRPEAEHEDGLAVGHVGVLDRLPGGRQHVGEVDEAVVGRAFGHLDRPVLRLRHAQELGLAAGHLAVELRVAEQRGAGAVLAGPGSSRTATAGPCRTCSSARTRC